MSSSRARLCCWVSGPSRPAVACCWNWPGVDCHSSSEPASCTSAISRERWWVCARRTKGLFRRPAQRRVRRAGGCAKTQLPRGGLTGCRILVPRYGFRARTLRGATRHTGESYRFPKPAAFPANRSDPVTELTGGRSASQQPDESRRSCYNLRLPNRFPACRISWLINSFRQFAGKEP